MAGGTIRSHQKMTHRESSRVSVLTTLVASRSVAAALRRTVSWHCVRSYRGAPSAVLDL